MKKTTATIALGLLLTTGFAQSPLPQIAEATYEYKSESQPVYFIVLPAQEDLGKMWSKHLKDKFGEKLSEKKGLWQSDAFEIPYSKHQGVVNSWVEFKGDSAILRANMTLGENIFSNKPGFEGEDSLFVDALEQFNYNYRVEYYQAKIKDLKRNRKDLAKSIRSIENKIKDNHKIIRDSERQAKGDAPNKNELLGKVKDLKKQNESLAEDKAAKKLEAIALDEEIEYYGKILKV